MDDGVVVLHPGVAHWVAPLGSSADGEERPEVDEAVIERVLGPHGKIEPLQLDAFAAGSFGKDFHGVALGTDAGDPAMIGQGVIDADAINALIVLGGPRAVGEQGERPNGE